MLRQKLSLIFVCVIAAVGLLIPAPVTTQDDTESDIPAVQAVIDAFNTGDVSGLDEFVDGDVVLHFLNSGHIEGLAGLEQWILANRVPFPDLQVSIVNEVVADDTAAFHWLLTGTHTGDTPDVPASGNEVAIEGMTMVRLVDSKVVEVWHLADEFAFFNQMQAGQSNTDGAVLSETVVFEDFGYSMSYPAGWTVETDVDEPFTLIYQVEEDRRLINTNGQSVGYTVGLDHRDISLMSRLGLDTENPTLEALYDLNSRFFGYDDDTVMIEETEIFGVPALRVRSSDRSRVTEVVYMGYVNDKVFLLSFQAPSEEALDEYIPTIDGMVASIEPVG